MTGARRLMLISVLAALAPPAAGQTLNDPTRPPAGLTAGAGDAAPAGTPVLQSVMISPRARAAIISGERVPLNGKFGAARVVRISETEVVLREGDQDLVLKLYPDVQKAGVAAATAPGAGKRARAGEAR